MALGAIAGVAGLVIPYIPTIISVMESVLGVDDKSKAGKILAVVQQAVGGVPSALSAITSIKAIFEGGQEPTDDQLRQIIADIKTNDATIHDLAQQAHQT